jgi:hypothetical protein
MTTNDNTPPQGDLEELLHRSQQMARDLDASDSRRRAGFETLVNAVETIGARYKDLEATLDEVRRELEAERSAKVALRGQLDESNRRYGVLSEQHAKVVGEFEAFMEDVARRTRQTLEDDRVIEAAVAMTEALGRFGDDASEAAPSAPVPPRSAPIRRDFEELEPAPAPEPMPAFLRTVQTAPEETADDVATVPSADPAEHEEERGVMDALRSGFGQLARVSARRG